MAKIVRTLYTVRSGDHAEVERIAYDYHEVLSIEHGGVEFVPVVRCKDCRYMHTVRNHLVGFDVDECWLHAFGESGDYGKNSTDTDGYCAWGERRGA